MAFALTGARVFTGDRFLDDHAVVISGKHIAQVVPRHAIGAMRQEDLGGGILAPGFIDVQVNGGGGALLNDNPSVETVRTIAASHRKFGTTGMLPTVITDSAEVRNQAIAAVKAALSEPQSGILGIHIEGPFLDLQRKGAHAASFIREMTSADVDEITGLNCGSVMITVAPNKVSPDFISKLAEHKVLVSLGHAEASYAEAGAALDAGARAFTHVFNAMSQMTGREPGMVGAALTYKETFIGLICDGHHVHDAAMRVVFAARPDTRIMLITDAMPAAAGGPLTFKLQGREVTNVDGRLQLQDGTLAGSNLTMADAVRYCVMRLGISLESALRMASLTPAAFLRREQSLGRIVPGFTASLVHLDDALEVRRTWVDGSGETASA
jgi:N-acetylglucosamine-6-phosphate deacetylase